MVEPRDCSWREGYEVDYSLSRLNYTRGKSRAVIHDLYRALVNEDFTWLEDRCAYRDHFNF